ncbi:MAG: glycoside hydrolase family 28 protein [Opitutaceae bacterium]|nr:glycoside hydrolase family 28 protein [Opitutaceae bacterium]
MKLHSRAVLRISQAILAAAMAANLPYAEEVRPEAPFPMPAIQLPSFPERDFRITDYGAVEGGEADNTLALRQAITACHDAGGGRVVVPPGTWLTGAIHLKSNVNLHLAEGAVLLFSDDPKDYLPAVQTSWEGMECFNYSPLIYAFECDNVALSGKGTLRPRMGTWTRWFARPPAHMEALKQLYNLAAKGVPVEKRQMAVGENNMRPDFVQFNRCRNVLIEDLKIRNSPFWCIHLLLCDGAVVRRVDISAHGHNNDGIDLALSRNIVVEDCTFDQGDDAIALKSGSNQDGWRLHTPTENVVVRRCTIRRGHQLVAIGSDLSGGIRNVYVHDCISSNDTDSAPIYLVFIKTNRGRGGFVENIWMENISAQSTRAGVLGIDTDVLYQWRDLVPIYEERRTAIRGIHLTNIKIGETDTPFTILGDAQMPVKDIFMKDITVTKARGRPHRYENAEGIHEDNVRVIEFLADAQGGN